MNIHEIAAIKGYWLQGASILQVMHNTWFSYKEIEAIYYELDKHKYN